MVIQTVSSRVESADSKQGLPSYDIVVILYIKVEQGRGLEPF
jgi:hypothetical protein